MPPRRVSHRSAAPLDPHAAFLVSWDWPRWLAAWREACGPLPSPLVVRVPIASLEITPSRTRLEPPEMYVWWPVEQVATRQRRLQFQMLRLSHDGPLRALGYHQRSGEQTTAELLAEAETVEERDALLIAAALHAYANSRSERGSYLPQQALNTIRTWAWEAAGIRYAPWHHWSPQALPDSSYPFGAITRDAAAQWDGDGAALARALGSYHRELLHSWRVVALVIDADGDPALVAACRNELATLKAKEREERAAWEAERAAKDEVAAREREEHRRLHPRAGEWPPTAEVLKELVWSMPTVEVAAQFGVSDVAVAKLCAKLNVPKPPRGFWRKVEAGQIKHPFGVVPREHRQR